MEGCYFHHITEWRQKGSQEVKGQELIVNLLLLNPHAEMSPAGERTETPVEWLKCVIFSEWHQGHTMEHPQKVSNMYESLQTPLVRLNDRLLQKSIIRYLGEKSKLLTC